MRDTLIALACTAAGAMLGLAATMVDTEAADEDAPRPAVRPPLALSVPTLQLAADGGADPLKRAPQAAPKRNAFAAQSWNPPAPPPAKPVPPPEIQGPPPPPPPTPPPPLPFSYLGQLDAAGERTVFYLAQGDKVHAVSVGDVIDGSYKFESDAGGQLQFTFLPLQARQTLALRRP